MNSRSGEAETALWQVIMDETVVKRIKSPDALTKGSNIVDDDGDKDKDKNWKLQHVKRVRVSAQFFSQW